MPSPLDDILAYSIYVDPIKGPRDRIAETLSYLWVPDPHTNKITIHKDFTYHELLTKRFTSPYDFLDKEALIRRILQWLPEADDLYLHDYFQQPYDKQKTHDFTS